MNEGSSELQNKFEYIVEEYQIPISRILGCASITSWLPFVGGVAGVIVGGVKKKLTSNDIPDDVIGINREKFYQMLCDYCDQLGYSETQLYDKACVSKAVYSNIRSMAAKGKTYVPSKVTVMCLCIALRLTVTQAEEMLNLVGYSFSSNLRIDKIISWCLEHREYEYDVRTINDVIYEKIGESPFLKLN